MTRNMVPPMIDTCNILTVTRNKYSDFTKTGTTATPCRIRHISRVVMTNDGQLTDTDAQIWLPYDAPITLDSLIQYQSTNYQIKTIDPAKRLSDLDVQFLKCDLKITDPIGA